MRTSCVALFLGVASCAPSEAREARTWSNFDRLVLAELEARGLEPAYADEAELCTRLFTDTLESRPTREMILAWCADRPLHEVVTVLTTSDDYRRAQRRRWAAYFRAGDDLVDQLYRGDLTYEQFAIRALAHANFVGRYLVDGQELTVPRAAFALFLGRPATTSEAEDLAVLWAPWRPNYIDGEGYSTPLIDPHRCEKNTRGCISTILGFAAVEFIRNNRAGLLHPDQLTGKDWDALQTPGRLFVAQPMFWEAIVDRTLQTYFGWDFGQALPEARALLSDELQKSGGDLLALERTILLSAPYAFAAVQNTVHNTSDPRYARGPTKFLSPEAWLHSAADFAGVELGDCDDTRFQNFARRLGGCTSEARREPGIEESIATDEIALELCSEHATWQDVQVMLERAYGRAATSAELEAIHAANPKPDPIALCAGILGGVEYAIY